MNKIRLPCVLSCPWFNTWTR